MTMRLSHEQLEELLGAYALDAVDDDEAAAVELHLHDCPRCRAEVAEHREVAAVLANAGAPAPAGIWDRISADLEEPPPQLELGRVIPIGKGRSAVFLRVAGAAVAAAAVLIAVLGVEVGRLNHRVSELQRPLQAQGLEQSALAALVDPHAQRIELRSDHSAATAQVVILPNGQAFMVQSTLPVLPSNETYQLWGLVGGRTKISLGLLGNQPVTTEFRIDRSSVSMLAVTAEPAGGVVTTDKPAVVWSTLPTVS